MRIIMLLIGLVLSGCASYVEMGENKEIWIQGNGGRIAGKILHCSSSEMNGGQGPKCVEAPRQFVK